jgi:hypothetical protein
MRKSQIYGHIFIYILTIVIVAFILIFGYRTITGFQDRAQQVFVIKFSSDLKSGIHSITRDYGSVIKKELNVGDKINSVCFIENYEKFDESNPQSDSPINPIIRESIRSKTGINVFLIGNEVKEGFSIGNISVKKDVLCIMPLGSKIELRLEGAGDHAIVSRWN